MPHRRRATRALPLLLALGLCGCDPRDCAIGISHGPCYTGGVPVARFPQDEAICQSYGLTPGTHDYAVCRQKKLHVRALSERETDFGALQNPLLPDLRPVLGVQPAAPPPVP